MPMDSQAQAVVAFASWLLLQLLNSPQAMYLPSSLEETNDEEDALRELVHVVGEPIRDPQDTISTALHNFRLCTSFNLFDDNLGYWVKPCSTTWFSRFLLNEYDNNKWVQMFRMTKPVVFALVDLLRPHIMKKNTKYRLAIHDIIRVACCLFKLTQGASLFICSEMFAIGKSTISAILRDVVHAINDTLRHELSWPTGECLLQTQQKIYNLYGLPAVVGAIDGTHIPISKPKHVPADYYYFKSGGYSLNCQAVVDIEKRFLDLYLEMPGSTNNSRVLRRSTLYDLAMHNRLVDSNQTMEGFPPYLISDLGYPLMPWLMVSHRTTRPLSVADRLFNKKLRWGRCMVENAFGILKQTFRELLTKTDLNVAFVPDVIFACAILHNVLLHQSHEHVENLLEVLRTEGLHGEVVDEEVEANEGMEGQLEASVDGMLEILATAVATEKCTDLGMYLLIQHLNCH